MFFCETPFKKMGLFSVSYQILNSQGLTKTQFKKQMNELMKKKGYVPAKEDEDGVSFSFLFSSDKRWISFVAEEETAIEIFGGGNAAEFLSRGLNTYVLRTEIVDSDYAELSLYNDHGAEEDVVRFGTVPENADTINPTDKEQLWISIFGNSFMNSINVLQKYDMNPFIEDTVKVFFNDIGLSDICFSEGIETTVPNAFKLEYKKKSIKIPPFQKRWLSACLEALNPYGFIHVKCKQMYLARVVADEIVQVIGFSKTPVINMKDQNRRFEIYVGIETVYCKEIDLDKKVNDIPDFGVAEQVDLLFNQRMERGLSKRGFRYVEGDIESEDTAIAESLQYLLNSIVPIMREINSLEKTLEYYQKVSKRQQDISCLKRTNPMDPKNVWLDGLMNYVMFNKEEFKHNRESYLAMRTKQLYAFEEMEGKKNEQIDKRIKEVSDYIQDEIKIYEKSYDDVFFLKTIMDEIERRKEYNIERLKKYGLYQEKTTKGASK